MMKWRIPLLAVSVMLTLGGCVVAPPPHHPPPPAVVYVPQQPPAEIVEVRPQPPDPRPVWFWAPGHWRWDGREYIWQPGHWIERPVYAERWEPPRWEHHPNGWFMIEGRWR